MFGPNTEHSFAFCVLHSVYNKEQQKLGREGVPADLLAAHFVCAESTEIQLAHAREVRDRRQQRVHAVRRVVDGGR